jgi:DNA-binding LacI/PurR family transcriptional regulator
VSQLGLFPLLVDALDDEHEVAVVRGAIAGAREAGATLLCIPGAELRDPDEERRARSFVYDLVSPKSAQGMLVLASALGSQIGPDSLGEWLSRYRPLPTVCIGFEVPGYRSVCVDNAGGFRSAVLHLVKHHSKRRVALIRGPSASPEAEDRRRAYLDALAAEGLDADPRLITEGDYTKESGGHCVRTLLDERRVNVGAIDAIASANDYMAIGAIEELTDRGVSVPEQLAVIGFDDVDSARLTRPTLSTVRQPTDSLGRDGVQCLASLVRGEPVAPVTLLSTELVIRHSCGCVAADIDLSPRTPSSGRRLEASFVARRELIVAELSRAARGRFVGAGPGWEGRLLEALLSDLRGGDLKALGRSVGQVLRRVERGGGNPALIHDVISALRRQALYCVTGDPVSRERIEDGLHDARVVSSSFLSQAVATRARTSMERFKSFARRAQSVMLGNLAELSDASAELLRPLGIEACVVAELVDPDRPRGKMIGRFGFGGADQRVQNLDLDGDTLLSHELFDTSHQAMVLLPLVNGRRPLGVALLAIAHLDGEVLVELRQLFEMVIRVNALARR